MSCAEIGWRAGLALRRPVDYADHVLRRVRPRHGGPHDSPPQWGELMLRGARADLPRSLTDDRNELLVRAGRALERVTLFGRYHCPRSPELRWNFDHSTDRPTPCGYAAGIDYRDFARVGDAKVVWELSRHHHLVVLARAYRFTGQRRYAERVVGDILSWIRNCPRGSGMGWRSPLELAVRTINWAVALEGVTPAGAPRDDERRTIASCVREHLRRIARNYSRHSSANNHLIGEAAGVFIGTSLLPGEARVERWRERAAGILETEIGRQTLADGVNCELATGYHLFVLEFFLLAGLAGRRMGHEFSAEYWAILERMFGFVAALLEGGGSLPMFGDSDDGYVLDLGRPDRRGEELLAAGAALFHRADFKPAAGRFGEYGFWLLGREGYERLTSLETLGDEPLRSRAFPQAGYYLLQRGRRDSTDRVSVTFDCGELGFGPIAAHGHADALSFTLRAFGVDVLVDPGTYDYFTDRGWRDHFRSTRAHNTVMVDGQNQSQWLGAFLWGKRARTRCTEWTTSERATTVEGEAEYETRAARELGLPSRPSRAGGPWRRIVHRRRLTLDHASGELDIADELTGRGEHTAEYCFQFSEQCSVEIVGHHQYRVECGRGGLILHMDPALRTAIYRGCSESRRGWVSRGYHHKAPAPALVASCDWRESLKTICRVEIVRTGGRRAVERPEPERELATTWERESEEVLHGTD